MTDQNLEKSIGLFTGHREDMARWLALELLTTDPEAQEDEVLQDHLFMLQEKLQAKMRAAVA